MGSSLFMESFPEYFFSSMSRKFNNFLRDLSEATRVVNPSMASDT